MVDKLSRGIKVDRFDNLSLNKALDTEDILDLDNEDMASMLVPISHDIIQQSLSEIDDMKEDIVDKELEHAKENKLINEFIIKKTINRLYDRCIATEDPKYYGLLKQFIEISMKNDEQILSLSGSAKREKDKISGNDTVNIQNNYYDNKPEIPVGSPAELLMAYGESDQTEEDEDEVEE